MPVEPHDGVKKVNRNVTYVDAAGKLRPAVITALGAGDAVTLRIGWSGETHADVALMVAHDNLDVWYGSSRRHFPHS